MIPRNFLDEILSRSDIISVIGSHIELKKKGVNFSALCPFHDEKTPSFTVNASKQFYHCFGCGASGDVVKFLMEFCGLTFPQVLNDLAKQSGLTIPNDSQIESVDFKKKNLLKKELKSFLVKAARFYQKNLKNNSKAIEYLKGRGISGKTALRFHLGVALNGWHELQEVFEDYDGQGLIDAGLVIKSESKSSGNYDRFRNRLMFPIFNLSGEVIGFGARTFGEEQPKYLNSPETEIFSKGKELFGIFESRSQISKSKLVIVVEGYMDVIGLYENGVKNAVASLGTSFTKTQFLSLVRMTESIVFMFDGDNAGQKAAQRALTVILPEIESSVNVSFVFLPEGKDPDSYIRSQGLSALNILLSKSMPMSEFILNLASESLNQNIAEGRTKIINNLVGFFKTMPTSLLKNQIILEAINRFAFSAEALTSNKKYPNYSNQIKTQRSNRKMFSEKLISLDIRVFKIFVRFPSLLDELDVLMKEIDNTKHQIFSDIQNNAIIFILENCDCSQDQHNNLLIIKEAVFKVGQVKDGVIDLLKIVCEIDLAIDDIPSYNINSARSDLRYILKRLVINLLESQASQIIKSGESFDKLSEIRTKISGLTGNKL